MFLSASPGGKISVTDIKGVPTVAEHVESGLSV